MFRTMITDTPFEQKWILQGRLCGVWALDLREKWFSTRSTREGRKCAVNLDDVVFVDGKGESVLLEMAEEGAVLRANRAYMKHVVESLKEQQREILKETQKCHSTPVMEQPSQPSKAT